MVGDGYTLFLPWETYRPEITQIKLQMAYVPHNGRAALRRSDGRDCCEPMQCRPRSRIVQVVPAQYQALEKK